MRKAGGEEFGLFLTGASLDEAAEIADRLRRAVNELERAFGIPGRRFRFRSDLRRIGRARRPWRRCRLPTSASMRPSVRAETRLSSSGSAIAPPSGDGCRGSIGLMRWRGARPVRQAADLRGLAQKAEIRRQRSGSLSMRAACCGVTHLRWRWRRSFHLSATASTSSGKRALRRELPRRSRAPWRRNSGRLRGGKRSRTGRLLRRLRGRLPRKDLPPLRPPLWQDPAAGVAAGDEQHLDAALCLSPGQRRDLEAAGRPAEKPAHPFHQMVACQCVHQRFRESPDPPIRLPPYKYYG